MNSDMKVSSPKMVYQTDDDEISLIGIYLTIKHNQILFFSVILLFFVISLFITFSKYQSSTPENIISGSQNIVTEYVLWIEVGMIYGENASKNLIDSTSNTVAKINTIYIPKVKTEYMKTEGTELNQLKINIHVGSGTHIIGIRATKMSDKIDYYKILTSIANLVLANHNEGLSLKMKDSLKLTKVIQEPTLTITKINNKKISNKKLIIIPILGIIVGIFFGFIAVFINEFLKKVKEAEKSV